MRTLIATSALFLATLAGPALAGDPNLDLLQREIIRLNVENAKLRKQLQDARDTAPEQQAGVPEQQAGPPEQQVPAPAKRAAARPKAPKTRDCPNRACKHGVIYAPWWRVVPVRVGFAWGYYTIRGTGPVGICGACGGKGRVEASLANK